MRGFTGASYLMIPTPFSKSLRSSQIQEGAVGVKSSAGSNKEDLDSHDAGRTSSKAGEGWGVFKRIIHLLFQAKLAF